MPTDTRKTGRVLRSVSAAMLVLLLAACGSPKPTTPTLSVNAIYTQAYETLVAAQATTVALTPPTPAASPTALPTLPAFPSAAAVLPTFSLTTPTAGSIVTTSGGTACDSAAFVADVTIPDNTVIDPGKAFTKTWTLLNNGTCTWGTGYNLTFQSGDQMSGPTTTPIAGSVAPGSSINISIKLTAPTANGTYKGIWRMTNTANQAFGDTPWVIIKVGAGTAATAVATGTACTTSCTVTVDMNLDASNVTLDFTKTKSIPTYTASGQVITFTVAAGWSGTITPTKGNGRDWSFSPVSITISNISQNTTISFTPSQIAPTATPTP